MTIAVTGAGGFIASHLVDELILSGHEVIAIDDLSGGYKSNVNKKAFFVEADCRDAKAMDSVFKTFRPEIVCHLAANAAENKSVFSPIDITSRNYDAFIKVLTPFIKYGGRRFVFTSSIAVYGSLQTPFKETDTPKPEDLYGISKLAAEDTLKIMSEVHGFEYVIARPHNVYGERQCMTDPYRNVMTIWMNSILRETPYFIYGDGKQRRCFSYIDDVINALYRCVFGNVNKMTFNIGADKDYSLNELDQILRTVVGNYPEAIHLPDRTNEVKIAISDHTQSKKFLNYEDKTSLLDGVKKTWDWVCKQGPKEPIYTDIEIDSKLLPKNWK